jgi:hypothetical protein
MTDGSSLLQPPAVMFTMQRTLIGLYRYGFGCDLPCYQSILELKPPGPVLFMSGQQPFGGRYEQFYEEADEILSHLPKRGLPMILQKRPDGTTLPFTIVRMGKRVRKLRDKLKLPSPSLWMPADTAG